MREYKIRAWDKEKKIMIHDFITFCLNNYKLSYNPWKDKRYIKMQYTGVKDDNNKEIYRKEIYEDDIIEDTKHNRHMRFFVVNDIRTITREFARSEHDSEWIVIGNKHENPELLKEC
jgi:hypothetical protein